MIQFEEGRPEYRLKDVYIEPNDLVNCLKIIFPEHHFLPAMALSYPDTTQTAGAIYQAYSVLDFFDEEQMRPTVEKYGTRLLNELCKQMIDQLMSHEKTKNN